MSTSLSVLNLSIHNWKQIPTTTEKLPVQRLIFLAAAESFRVILLLCWVLLTTCSSNRAHSFVICDCYKPDRNVLTKSTYQYIFLVTTANL